jgi:hypothetical protein
VNFRIKIIVLKNMTFERTIANKEEETLKTEEETSTATGEAVENETDTEEDTSTNETDTEGGESEESVEALKVRLQKAEEDRDNYKNGMLVAKGKKRGEEGLQTEKYVPDVNEEAVVKVLSKREEQKALHNTIDTKSPDYIPELVDDNQYNEIIGYLPRNVDKTSYDSIVRGLKLATEMWKKERGIQDKSPKKDTKLQTTKSTTSSGTTKPVKNEGRRILKGYSGVNTWFN